MEHESDVTHQEKVSVPHTVEEIQTALIDRGQALLRLWTDFEMLASKLATFGVTGFKVQDLMRSVGRQGLRGGSVSEYSQKAGKAIHEADSNKFSRAQREFMVGEEIAVVQRLVDALGKGMIKEEELPLDQINAFLSNMRDGLSDINTELQGGVATGAIVRKHEGADAQRSPESTELLERMRETHQNMSDEIAEMKKLLLRAKAIGI